jgi:uncharacterized membrane protein
MDSAHLGPKTVITRRPSGLRTPASIGSARGTRWHRQNDAGVSPSAAHNHATTGDSLPHPITRAQLDDAPCKACCCTDDVGESRVPLADATSWAVVERRRCTKCRLNGLVVLAPTRASTHLSLLPEGRSIAFPSRP